MATLDEIQKQIADLQAQAEQMLREKRADILEQVRTHIKAYGLSAAECGFEVAPARRKGKKRSKAVKDGKPAKSAIEKKQRRAKSPAMTKPGKKSAVSGGYRGPNGEQWAGGKGPRPKWVKEILAEGRNLDDYRI